MSTYGSTFQIHFENSLASQQNARYYLLLENKDRRGANCRFYGKIRIGLPMFSNDCPPDLEHVGLMIILAESQYLFLAVTIFYLKNTQILIHSQQAAHSVYKVNIRTL